MNNVRGTVIFGAAKEIITPTRNMPLIGFGDVFGAPFSDIHDDLYARTLYLEDDRGTAVLLIALDILFHDASLSDALRRYARNSYDLSEDDLLITYTHTHYAPAVKGYEQIWYDEEYERYLLDRCCRCIDRAYMTKKKGVMKFAAVEGDWNVSRRLMVDGKMTFNPNVNGERDPNLYLLKFEDTQGNMRALAASFACHPSNLGEHQTVSSEYPGRLCQLIEGTFYGCTALFFQGFGADTKLKKDMKNGRFSDLTFDECDEVAASMLTRIRQRLIRSSWQNVPFQLKSRVFTVQLPLVLKDRAYFEAFRDFNGRSTLPAADQNPRLPRIDDNKDTSMSRFWWERADHVLENYDSLPETLSLSCGVIRINPDFYIFSIGGEPGVNLQTVLREYFPGKQILCFGYNDAVAYIPSDKMIIEGGYEAAESSTCEFRLKGTLACGVNEIICRGFSKALEAMEAEG